MIRIFIQLWTKCVYNFFGKMCGKIIFRVFYRNQKRLHVQNKHLHKQPLTLSRNPGLNRGPTHYECVALPTELIRLTIICGLEKQESWSVHTPQQHCHYIGSFIKMQVLFGLNFQSVFNQSKHISIWSNLCYGFTYPLTLRWANKQNYTHLLTKTFVGAWYR